MDPFMVDVSDLDSEIDDDLVEKDLGELIEEFQDANGLWRIEGESGLDNLTKIVEKLGYEESGFKYGSPIESFLADNSGAIEAILEWIGETNLKEWREKFSDMVSESEEDADSKGGDIDEIRPCDRFVN